jgi:predicted nucleotidyltransferase/uncharacterized protein (UPF0332 family)
MPVAEKKLPIPTKRDELRKTNVPEKDYKIAYDFAAKVYKQFGPVVLSVVLFGSAAKGTPKPESDVDVVIIVDNVSMVWDEEVVSWYREELFKIIKNDSNRDKLHVNTVALSAFWDNVRAGDPAVINMLRYGIALLDLGFFEPLKYLLMQGRIRPTAEAIYTVLTRVPMHLLRSRVKTMSAIDDLHWATVDSAHAALMVKGQTPPSPEHIAEMLTETYVKKNKLSKQYVDWYSELYIIAHNIKNHKVHRIEGDVLEKWYRRVHDFTRVMEKLAKEGEHDFLKKQ